MSTVHANGIDIYYEICGRGPPLTLIMGLGCSARQWQWMVPVFAKSFKVITFDNRGVGRSDKPDMEYSTEMFAADTRALLDVLDIPRTHLFGVSVGGMIAQRFSLKYPEMVDRLVLGCTMPSLFHLPAAPEDSETMRMSRVVSIEEGAEKMMSLFLSEGFFKEEPKRVTALKEVIMLERKEQGDDAFMLQLGAAMKHNTVDEAKNILAPALVISGTKDPIARLENAHFFAKQIPVRYRAVRWRRSTVDSMRFGWKDLRKPVAVLKSIYCHNPKIKVVHTLILCKNIYLRKRLKWQYMN